jgi:nicotinamidase-related amidase
MKDEGWRMEERVHRNVLTVGEAALVVVDMQEAFRAEVLEFDAVAGRIATAVEAAKLLGVPVLATEQVRAKLGKTVDAVAGALPVGAEIVDKTAFSCCGSGAFMEQLAKTGAKQVMVCGLETHVCVNQTVHDLLAGGYQVHLLTDCVTSRTEANRELGIAKMLKSGAIGSGLEMALFELMRDARHEQFRAVSKMIK